MTEIAEGSAARPSVADEGGGMAWWRPGKRGGNVITYRQAI